MDSTKNFFDAWINTQNKLVNNFVDTSKKIQNSLKGGDVMEKSTELYNNWFEKQKNIANTLLSTLKGEDKEVKSSELLHDWMSSQMELGKQMVNFLSNGVKQSTPNGALNGSIGKMQNIFQDWTNVYNQLFGISNPLVNLHNPNFNMGGFNNLINNTQTYMKMFELWQPFYKMFQSNTVGSDSLYKMMDMEKYQEVMDSMFNFMGRDKSQSFLEQIQNYTELFTQMVQGAKPAPLQHLQNFLPDIITNNLSGVAEITQYLGNHINKIINPYFTMTPAGREKDLLQLMMTTQEKFTQYYVKSSELQYLIYNAGQKAMTKVFGQITAKVQENPTQTLTFDDFYSVWVNIMEADLIELFGSDVYAKALGDSLKIALEAKSGLDKQMEYMLAPFPIVPRSEVDEMNKTIYELRAKVRNLESKIEKLTTSKTKVKPQEKTVAKKTTPKTTTKTSTTKKTTASRSRKTTTSSTKANTTK